jgi:hypothetical protein
VIDASLVVARAGAQFLGRAVPIRTSSLLSPDPEPVFGFAPIRVVSEQRVQAIAYGRLGSEPEIVVAWNPLSRDAAHLEQFAAALYDYLTRALAVGRLPRIWVPHPAALEILDLLGHRYRTNQNASETLRVMGRQCRALAQEAKYAGQQVVAVASSLLTDHVVTGQSPKEDHHLGALLAWIDPPPSVNPLQEASRAALVPAAAMLAREVDDRVEKLRRAAKGIGAAAASARSEIEDLLESGARAEWELLVRAREAFWGLGLPPADLTKLVKASLERITWSLTSDRNPPSRTHSLARLLDAHEHAMELLEDASVRGDAAEQERARRKGKVVRTAVIGITQPNGHGRNPCSLQLRVEADVWRVRVGTVLQDVTGGIEGRVTGISEDGSGATILVLSVSKGVRSLAFPGLGTEIDWADTVVYSGQFRRGQVYSEMEALAHPVVYGDELPAPVPRAPSGDLLAIANALRES